MKVNVYSFAGNIVVDVIKGKKAQTWMFDTKYVDLKTIQKKVSQLCRG